MSYEFIDTAASALAAIPTNALPNAHLLGAAVGAGNAAGGDIVSIPDPARAQLASILSEENAETILFLEPEQAAGGGDDDSDTIVVIGKKLKVDAPGSGGGGSANPSNNSVYIRGDYMYDTGEQFLDAESELQEQISPPADHKSIEITVNIDPLTPEQEAVVEKFKTAVQDANKAIQALADDERITMNDGSVVTGADLKQIWANTDFVINPEKTSYRNGTQRGEADYRNDNPQVSFNIDTIDGYEDHGAAGLNFMILHEIGQLTGVNRAFDAIASNPQSAVEQMANDIARAIAHDAGIAILGPSLHITYGTQSPLTFAPPAGSGGGGGWGDWQNDEPL